MPPPRTALIAGATGLVGRHTVQQLVASHRYQEVVAIGRRPVTLEHPKLRQMVVDFDDLGGAASMAADDVFCCLGTTMRKAGNREAFRRVDLEYPLRLATVALAHGASQYLLVSSIGANPASRSFYLRVKGELERALRDLLFRRLSVFRPALLLGPRAELRWGERLGAIVFRGARPLFVGPFRKYRPIEANTVARAMVKVAEAGTDGYRVVESDEIAAIAEQ
jgi:uncharacterized protein YbjT (DUF2867 family)